MSASDDRPKPSSPRTAVIAPSADPVVTAYAQWLADSLAEHRAREEGLSREISAVREAAAVGAAALIELRSAVQSQLENVAKQLGRLEQDLEATKLELAEVVIDKEADEGELKQEVDHLRRVQESDRHSFRSLFNEVQELQEQKAVESRQAWEREIANLRQLLDSKVGAVEDRVAQRAEAFRDSASQRLEERFDEGREINMGLFRKIDKVMQDQLEHLRQTQVEIETKQTSAQVATEKLRSGLEECELTLARKFQTLHEQLEPRVSMIEESQRSADNALEHFRGQVKDLLMAASRHSAEAIESAAADLQVNKQPSALQVRAESGSSHGGDGSRGTSSSGRNGSEAPRTSATATAEPTVQGASAKSAAPSRAKAANSAVPQPSMSTPVTGSTSTDAWRFSHSISAPVAAPAPTAPGGKPMWTVAAAQPQSRQVTSMLAAQRASH
mmetsp:Transcript_99109/g.179009  ORF Transcript_99109/g.179009 Transcript_99109/m.179009 type:complete len:443 (-) Transcript_99109:108-1436(-)